MPTQTLFPFYHQIDKNERLVDQTVNQKEREIVDFDWDDSKYMMEYRKNLGWDSKAKRGMAIYNVVQTMSPDDEISRIFLGGTRTQIDRGIEQMTEGEPDFDFEPFGPSDHIKTIIWKHMMRMILSQCEYRMHQETFFRDYFVMGSGVFEVYIDYPQRTIRVPNAAFADGFEQIVVRDHRRPKVGVRAVNPINCWRNPNIDSPTQVPSCLKRRTMTWNQFAQDFGRCFNPDGKSKYMNLDKIAKGSHVCVYEYQDELRDVIRRYAKSYGNESDGMATSPNPESGLGVLIFNESLKLHEQKKDGIVTRCTGLNIQGMCTLRWGTFFDAYDKNYDGNHSVYGMGLPQRLEGEDTAMQTIFNMNLDNYRWASTVALNYEGSQQDSYMDVDANRLYGGELIDGTITPQPLGIARIADYQAMKETIDQDKITATGINHQQIVGDTSKTAYEFAQRIRQSNRSSEQRLTRLENEVFKPVGKLLLGNALTNLTVKEYEAMTEEQVASARDAIKSGKSTVSDYQDLNGKEPKRRSMTFVPLKGEKIREDFSATKQRKLDYNSTDNTLIMDNGMNVETSYIPMTEEYVYPTEYLESGLLPDVIVDSKRMLGDLKAQDVQNFQAATNFLLQIMQLELQTTGKSTTDLEKLKAETLEFAEIDPKRVLNTDEGASDVLSKVKDIVSEMESQNQQPTQPPNAQVSAPIPAVPNFGGANPQPGGVGSPQNALQATASGAL